MSLTPQQRMVRVFILMEHFIRNAAYFRATKNTAGDRLTPDREFWNVTYNNQIDIAVLEWCKLFADRNGRHGWRAMVADEEAFQSELLVDLACSTDEFAEVIQSFKSYRDEFVAHLDDGIRMNIPNFDIPIAATRFLFGHLICVEAPALGMNVDNREGFDPTFDHHYVRAREEYGRLSG